MGWVLWTIGILDMSLLYMMVWGNIVKTIICSCKNVVIQFV